MSNEQSDRELLEAAANAAGLRLSGWNEDRQGYYIGSRLDLAISGYWNPLHDDGDVLRLALTCGIQIWNDSGLLWVNHKAVFDRAVDPHGDMNSATRRAVVGAAAEIGRRRKLLMLQSQPNEKSPRP